MAAANMETEMVFPKRLGAHQDQIDPKLDAINAIFVPGRAHQDFLGRGVPPIHFQNAAVRARKSARSIPFEKHACATLEVFLVKHALMERAVPPSSIQSLKPLSTQLYSFYPIHILYGLEAAHVPLDGGFGRVFALARGNAILDLVILFIQRGEEFMEGNHFFCSHAMGV